MRLRLIRAYNRYTAWCSSTKQQSRVIEFTEDNLHMKGKYVYLTSKAADARHFIGFLFDVVTSDGAARGTPWSPNYNLQFDLIAAVAWGLYTYYEVEYRAGRWFTDDNIRDFSRACNVMLVSFTALHFVVGIPTLFKPKPKDHQLTHLAENWCSSTRVNPRCCANYKNENFVRLMKRMAHAVDKKKMAVRTVEHFLLQAGITWASIAAGTV